MNVGGYIHLVANNIEEAIKIAKGFPGLHGPYSTIEVREFMEMP